MHIETVDWTEPNLLHGDSYGTTLGLPLFTMGQAARVALILETESTDREKDEGVIYGGNARNPAAGIRVSSAEWVDETTQSKLRSNWNWRWWPGDWNAVYFTVAVMSQTGTDQPLELRISTFRYSGEPMIATPPPSDPHDWPALPGSVPEIAMFPSDAAEGEPYVEFLKIIHPIVPAWSPTSDDLQSDVLYPLESKGQEIPPHTLPLPLPDYLGRFEAFFQVGNVRLNIPRRYR